MEVTNVALFMITRYKVNRYLYYLSVIFITALATTGVAAVFTLLSNMTHLMNFLNNTISLLLSIFSPLSLIFPTQIAFSDSIPFEIRATITFSFYILLLYFIGRRKYKLELKSWTFINNFFNHCKHIFDKVTIVLISFIGLVFTIVNMMGYHNLLKDLLIVDRSVQFIYSLFLPMYTLIIFPIFIYYIFKRFTLYESLKEPLKIRLKSNYLKTLFIIELMYMIPFLMICVLDFILNSPISIGGIDLILLIFEFSKYLLISIFLMINNIKLKWDVKNIVIIIMIVNFVISYVVLTYR